MSYEGGGRGPLDVIGCPVSVDVFNSKIYITEFTIFKWTVHWY